MGKIRITRKAYTRKAYKRKDGTKVSEARVPKKTYLIEDPGRPGRGTRGAEAGPYKGQKKWIRRTGKLGGAGYAEKGERTRREILDKAVKKYGYRSALGSVQVLLLPEGVSVQDKRVLGSDREYLKKKYGGSGSFGPRKKR